jgi:hypothetical protein
MSTIGKGAAGERSQEIEEWWVAKMEGSGFGEYLAIGVEVAAGL